MELDPIDQRVLGSLLEKERTVPATYPLTLNALKTACNQTSGRNPLTDYGDRDVTASIDRLKAMGLARIVHAGTGARATKYRQVLDEKLELTKAERAVVTLLLLRGPQTPGELRSRSDRLHTFHEAADVEATLQALAARDEPLTVELERQPGQKERRWRHLLGPVDTSTGAASAPGPAPRSEELVWWQWWAEHLTDDSELPEVGTPLDGRRWMVIEVTEDDATARHRSPRRTRTRRMATKRDPMVWPAVALVVTQVVHGAVPVDADHPENEGYTGLVVGGILLLLSVVAVVQLVQHRGSGRPLAAWTGLAVAVGFVAYHAVPWTSVLSNPYLGQPVGAPAWITVFLSVGAGSWCAWEGRTLIGTKLGLYRPAVTT